MTVFSELHLHSCLSPCAQFHMHPEQIAIALSERNIELCALTDCNSAMNVPAFAIQCARHNLSALYGMEAQTAEGVRALVLFNDPVTAVELGSVWYEHLQFATEYEGQHQVYVDECGSLLGVIEKTLLCNSDVSIFDLASEVHLLGGLIIPCYVDSKSFSFMSRFGQIPRGPWDALEFLKPEKAPSLIPCAYPVIHARAVHFISDVGQNPLKLDTENVPLKFSDGRVNVDSIRTAFEKLVVRPE